MTTQNDSATVLVIVTVSDGASAIAALRDVSPELILLDVMMPGRDGYEVCRQIKASPATRLTPLILMSALGETPDRIRGIEAGADGFLQKPMNDLEFISTVRSRIVAKKHLDQLESTESVMLSMARAIEGRDPDTGDHADRLSRMGAALGARLGLAESDLTALWRAGVLHDIGKIAIPDSVLLKPRPLTLEEREVMKSHARLGEEMLRPLRSLRDVLPIVRHHHERFDGSGYPDGLVGDEIPLTARILQMVDVYDALTSARPYKQAMSSEDALGVMADEADKGWLDPELFSEFCDFVATLEDDADPHELAPAQADLRCA